MDSKLSGMALELRDIAKRFGRHWVLTSVNFDLRRGDSLVLYGSNGSGKTTLLRILAGSLKANSGEGRVFGYDLFDGGAVREHAHFIGHQQGLYADLTVEENLKFAASMYNVRTTGIPQCLDKVGLSHARHKRVRELSAGMRKRAVLGRMLLVPSPLLLLDEPFANLDADGKQLAQDLLIGEREKGRTLVISSHEPQWASALGTHFVTLSNGRLT